MNIRRMFVDAESGAIGGVVGPSQFVYMRDAEVTRAEWLLQQIWW
jgi:hypothetical protein